MTSFPLCVILSDSVILSPGSLITSLLTRTSPFLISSVLFRREATPDILRNFERLIGNDNSMFCGVLLLFINRSVLWVFVDCGL